MKKRVFVTGHRGYIGTHLIHLLKESGHHVTGCDSNLFEECACTPFTHPDVELTRDFRSLTVQDLDGHDCVMHLAALSNDPMGELDVRVTREINYQGTVVLAQAAKQAGIPLFLFASSCSIYGKGAQLTIAEEGVTAPLTAYAASKIDAERALSDLSSEYFHVGLLRNATAYGFSPMLRIDLVVNNLLASAFTKGEIRVMSDGTSWRPLIHCQDIAHAFITWMKHPPEEHSLALNIGNNAENYQVRDMVQKIHAYLPGAKPVFTGEIGADPRNYRVNFDLLKTKLPQFTCSYTIDEGIEELIQKYKQIGFSSSDFDGDRFVRLRTLKRRSCLS